MPTFASMALRKQVVDKLKEIFPEIIEQTGRIKTLLINKTKIYLRVTTEKAGSEYKYWFDINQDFYENEIADFFVYACGSINHIYIFPVNDFNTMISGASVGGVNQAQNFTIFLDSHKFEPAGRSNNKHDIAQYYNNFELILLSNQEITYDINRPEELNPPDLTLEERRRIKYHHRIERNLQLSEAAKKIHGYTCQVCGFNYEKVYGKLGHKYIEAHHLMPLSELPPNQSIKLSAKDDFAVLCSNCHSMIHREQKSLLSLADLKEILQIMKGLGIAHAQISSDN